MDNVYLAGFENNGNGRGAYFNFILINELKSQQDPSGQAMSKHMIPFEGRKIKMV